jgi:hypothetical protein
MFAKAVLLANGDAMGAEITVLSGTWGEMFGKAVLLATEDVIGKEPELG